MRLKDSVAFKDYCSKWLVDAELKEIIRCKDCMHYYRQSTLAEAECTLNGEEVDDNDYCSKAVRK